VLKLTVRNGQFEGVTVEVEGDFAIGRAQDSGLFLPDPQVSRTHSKIFKDGSLFWITDNKSHNGTHVNEIRIDGRRVLRNGDVIRIGSTSIGVFAPEEAAVTGKHKIEIEEEAEEMTMTVERNARDLAPPTIDAITSAEAVVDGFSFPSIAELRKAPDKSLAMILSKAKRFAILFHVAKSLQEATDTDRLLAIMMDYVFKVMKADRGEIVLVNPDTQELVPVLSMDREGRVSDTVRLSRTVIGKSLNSRMAIISTDARSDPRLQEAESIIMYGMRSIMCVPMISKESVIGIVQVVNEKDFAAFGEDDLYLLTVIASLAAVSIENARLYERQKTALEDLRRAHEELKQAQTELIHQEKLATVGQLASGIAHEIKNSLGPMALVHLLKERHPEDDVLQEYANMILESHNRIRQMVSEVRDFTSGKSREFDLERRSLRELLESVLNFLKFDKDVKRAAVKLHVHEQVDSEVDFDRLKQVVINLVRNSAQALPERGGKIDVVLTRDGDYAVIRIVDNGCGIPEELLEKIWTPFFTTKEGTGMGLGLDISRMIVEQHNGKMECNSKVGRGTVMSILLPIAT